MTDLKKTDRTTISRYPNRGSYDKEVIKNILKEGLVCHISFVHEGQPYLLPNLYGLGEDVIYIHGSVGSFLQRTLMREIELCFAVTLIDGLVLARSAFHHSVNFRSVVLFGKARVVEAEDDKFKAMEVLTEHVVPGRWMQVRQPTKSELKKTLVLAIDIHEASAKIREGGPIDDDEDYRLTETWAGILPLNLIAGTPIPDVRSDHNAKLTDNISKYKRNK